jgi:threonine dehydrogenase-like Zn-dependent dehydrogenase
MHLAARIQDKVPLAELISHRFSIEDAGKALEVTRSGAATKAVIDPSIS